MEPEELAAALKGLNAWAQEHAPPQEAAVRRRLRRHFGSDPIELPIVSRPLSAWDRPNFQVAIDRWGAGREVEVVGLPTMQGMRAGLGELIRGPEWLADITLGAAEHVSVALGEDERVVCVQAGLWLVRDGEGALAAMLKAEDRGMGETLTLELIAPERERAERVIDELWALMRDHNVYRGRILELTPRHFHGEEGAPLTVRTLPPIARERIVLPDGLLERIERQAFGIARHAKRLVAGGRHLRRGLLLHGPPGTGKTLTAMYLATQMAERTTILLTGQSFRAIGPSIDLATALQPSIVILEDVDLVALDRSHEPTNAVLFELLNAMDGLDADHDVLFVLSTNRADLLEPALASRPGRVDQAVELPLPDAEGRRRLLALYGEGLAFERADDRALIDALAGVSPAFIRELLRRAALIAAERDADGDALHVLQADLHAALAELRETGDALTGTLLGADGPGRAPSA